MKSVLQGSFSFKNMSETDCGFLWIMACPQEEHVWSLLGADSEMKYHDTSHSTVLYIHKPEKNLTSEILRSLV